MLENNSDTLEKIFQYLYEHSGRMINKYGFYIPTDPYRFVFWKDLIIAILFILVIWFWFRYRLALKYKLSNIIKKSPPEAETIYEDTLYNPPSMNDGYSSNATGNTFTKTSYNTSARDDYYLSKTEQIYKAISNSNNIFIEYVKYDGTRSSRRVKPYKIYTYNNREYFEGFCYLRQEERNFKISRIEKLKIEI